MNGRVPPAEPYATHQGDSPPSSTEIQSAPQNPWTGWKNQQPLALTLLGAQPTQRAREAPCPLARSSAFQINKNRFGELGAQGRADVLNTALRARMFGLGSFSRRNVTLISRTSTACFAEIWIGNGERGQYVVAPAKCGQPGVQTDGLLLSLLYLDFESSDAAGFFPHRRDVCGGVRAGSGTGSQLGPAPCKSTMLARKCIRTQSDLRG